MGTDQLFCDSECVVSPWCRQSTPLCIPLTSTRLQLDQCEYCEMLDSAYFDTRTELLKERIDVARRLSDDAASDSKNSRNGAPSPENDNHRRGVGGEGGGPLNDENQRAPAQVAQTHGGASLTWPTVSYLSTFRYRFVREPHSLPFHPSRMMN